MKIELLIIITLISMSAAACGKASKNNDEARDLFSRNCAICHGTYGEGEPLGGVRAPSLKREEALKYSDQLLFDKIYKGGTEMPSFKNSLTEEQIKGLVRFIREEIQAPKAST